MGNIKLNKVIWTENEFDLMDWHDSYIHAIAFERNYEFILDIDYIFSWIKPSDNNNQFGFFISPCTLVFENVHDLKLDIQISEPFKLQISNITLSNPQRPINADYINREVEYYWTISTQQGDITLKSVGFKQYVRGNPKIQHSQFIDLIERGGISFERTVVSII